MYIGDNRRHPRTGSDGLCPTDSELLRSARDGDTAAFHQLVDRHAADLFRLACAMTGNTADAEDALQETFMGAFQRMSSFAGRSRAATAEGFAGRLSPSKSCAWSPAQTHEPDRQRAAARTSQWTCGKRWRTSRPNTDR